MKTTDPDMPFDLSSELRDDPWLPWLLEHAHPDLWAPRVPLAVIDRIRRHFNGQKKNTLITLWIGIRRLLVLYSKSGRADFSVRDIASIAGVSRSRLCGNSGFIQDLLAAGVISVTALDEPAVSGAKIGTRFQGRTRYAIDMPTLEAESLVLLRQMFSSKESIPRREADTSQRSLLDLLAYEQRDKHTLNGSHENPAVPSGTKSTPEMVVPSSGTVELLPLGASSNTSGDILVSCGTTNGKEGQEHLVPHETGSVSHGAALSSHGTSSVLNGAVTIPHETSTRVDFGSTMPYLVPNDTMPVSHGAVGMDGMGMVRIGGREEENPLSRRETIELIQSAIQGQIKPMVDLVLAARTNGATQTTDNTPQNGQIPAPPPGEPALTIGLHEAWALYKEVPAPLDLHRLALLPHRFDTASGDHGAYWLTRAILMLSERPVPVTLPYLRGVLERMERAGDWSTTQLEAPPEAYEKAPRTSAHERGRVVPPGVPGPETAAVALPTEPRTPTLTAFYRYAPAGLQLTVDQERRLQDRVRDQTLWNTVCTNWRADGHKFSNSDNVLDRYCTMEAQQRVDAPAAPTDGLSKLEREIYALSGLSDEDKARYCAKMMTFTLEDRKRFVEDLRKYVMAQHGEGARS